MTKADVMRACLAEAGFPDAVISGECWHCDCGYPTVHELVEEGFAQAVHRAFLVMGHPTTPECYECWAEFNQGECPHSQDST